MMQPYSTTNDDHGDETIVAKTEPLSRTMLRRIEKHVYDPAQTHINEFPYNNRGLYPEGAEV